MNNNRTANIGNLITMNKQTLNKIDVDFVKDERLLEHNYVQWRKYRTAGKNVFPETSELRQPLYY